MPYYSPIGSPERHRFLEQAQDDLLESLDIQRVAIALGETAVNTIRNYSESLFVPNIRNDRAVMPSAYRGSDSIPFFALKEGEEVNIERSDIMLSPRQRGNLLALVEQWSDLTGTPWPNDVNYRIITLAESKIPPSGARVALTEGAKGGKATFTTGIYGKSIGLKHPPKDFYLKLRPAVALSFSRGHVPPVTLFHELIHVDQHFKTVISPDGIQEQQAESYRDELEAHHYSAKYAQALFSQGNFIKRLWRYPDILLYSAVENVREKYADPAKPFDPNEELIEQLKKIGVAW